MRREKIQFLIMCRELLDHTRFMHISTKYGKGKFNYDYYNLKLQQYVKTECTKEEIKEIYPSGLY